MFQKRTNKIFSAKRIIFIILFFMLVLVGQRINFSPVIGADKQYFTLFQFFGPIAGAFLGPVFGVISVLGAQLADFFLVGKAFSLINIIRLTPMLFAAYYFGTKKRVSGMSVGIIIPLIAMAAFMLHPIGKQVWFFSLYWSIPVIVKLLPKKYSCHVLLNSLGATFTAHAVGTAAWIWSVPMTAEQWIALIPVVAYERLLFTIGIASSYVIINTALDIVIDKFKLNVPTDVLFLDKGYLLLRK